MTDEITPKKRGWPKGMPRPKKSPLPTATDGNAGELKEAKKPRPLCETSELAKYPDPKKVIWGVQPECPRFKRKGLAILYNPAHKGGQVTLMPVTDDGGELRWRYRGVPGPAPFHYDKIDLEPGQAATTPTMLRQIADELEGVVKEHFGDVRGADKTTEEFLESKRDDRLGEKFKKLKGGW